MAFTGVPGKKVVSNKELTKVTRRRPKHKQFLELAKRNDPHFAPHASGKLGERGDHKAEWRKWHGQALMKVIGETSAGHKGIPDEAIVINGFAAHFLTDAFSVGFILGSTTNYVLHHSTIPVLATK